MRLRTLRLIAIPLWICAAAAPLRADVTVRYRTDMKMNLPVPAKEQAEKDMRDTMARFGNLTLRMKNGKALSVIGSFNSIIDYNTQQVTLFDNEHKTFSTFPLSQFADKVSAAMPQMPEEAKKAMEGIKATVNSQKSGRTDTIQGIQAEENEVTIVIEIPMPARATASMSGMTMKMVMHMWSPKSEETLRNQAVRELTGYNLYANALMNPAGMIQKMLGAMGGKDNSFASLFAELSRKKTMMLRMVIETYMQMPSEVTKMMAEHGAPIDVSAPMFSMTQEAVEVSSAPVDESVFQVPADFQRVEPDVMIKSLMADQMSAMGKAAPVPAAK